LLASIHASDPKHPPADLLFAGFIIGGPRSGPPGPRSGPAYAPQAIFFLGIAVKKAKSISLCTQSTLNERQIEHYFVKRLNSSLFRDGH
jgi:hypothetical protein